MKHERKRPPMPVMIIGGILAAAVGITVFSLIFGFAVMYLWNWLMPALFHLGTLTFWQAFGFLVLIRILFAPIHFRHHRHKRGWKKRDGDWDCCDDDWKVRGSWNQWHHYNDYWRSEGKAHFEEYLARKDAERQQKDTHEA